MAMSLPLQPIFAAKRPAHKHEGCCPAEAVAQEEAGEVQQPDGKHQCVSQSRMAATAFTATGMIMMRKIRATRKSRMPNLLLGVIEGNL